MASSDRRGKLKIETCLKSDRLEIVVHEAEGLRNDFDESELNKMFEPIRTRKNNIKAQWMLMDYLILI